MNERQIYRSVIRCLNIIDKPKDGKGIGGYTTYVAEMKEALRLSMNTLNADGISDMRKEYKKFDLYMSSINMLW